MISTEKKKRGRKPKLDINVKSENTSDNIENQIIEENDDVIKDPEKIPKKRGRKPKGGKIIENINPSLNSEEIKPNIILHLKCNSKDLDENLKDDNLESYTFSDNKINDLGFNFLKEKKENIINDSSSENNLNNIDYNSDLENENNSDNLQKDIYKKLKELSINLHTNNIPDKTYETYKENYDLLINNLNKSKENLSNISVKGKTISKLYLDLKKLLKSKEYKKDDKYQEKKIKLKEVKKYKTQLETLQKNKAEELKDIRKEIKKK